MPLVLEAVPRLALRQLPQVCVLLLGVPAAGQRYASRCETSFYRLFIHKRPVVVLHVLRPRRPHGAPAELVQVVASLCVGMRLPVPGDGRDAAGHGHANADRVKGALPSPRSRRCRAPARPPCSSALTLRACRHFDRDLHVVVIVGCLGRRLRGHRTDRQLVQLLLQRRERRLEVQRGIRLRARGIFHCRWLCIDLCRDEHNV